MATRRTSDSKRTPRSAEPPPEPTKPVESRMVHDAPLSNTPTRKRPSAKAPAAASPPSAAASPQDAVKKPAPRRRAVPSKKQTALPATSAPPVSEDERRGRIAVAAYLRGERRGFAPGGEVEDWLVAEKEIDALLLAGREASAPSGRAS